MRCVCRAGFKNIGTILNARCEACPAVITPIIHHYRIKQQTKKVQDAWHVPPLQSLIQLLKPVLAPLTQSILIEDWMELL